MTIKVGTRIYCALVHDYGTVTRVISTGIASVKQYQIRFENGSMPIFGEAFIVPAERIIEPKGERAPASNVVAFPRRFRMVVGDGPSPEAA